MKRALLLAVLSLPAGCSRREARNYKNCLRLRVGMSKTDMFKVMGAPDDTIPYVEGKSLSYLKGRTAYEWSNPASMPSGDHVSVDDASEKVESIRCSNSEITAAVYVEPPAPSTATAVGPSQAGPTGPEVPIAPATVADAIALYRKKEFLPAMRIAEPLARAGDPDAQMLAGMIFLAGAVPGKEQEGQTAALMWLYKSSRQKDAEAQAVYAATLMGNGTPAETVVDEIKLAADLKSPAGELLEADVYLMGLYPDLVPPDDEKGEKWLSLAAQGGDPAAELALARRFQTVHKDLVSTYRWAFAASQTPLVGKLNDPLHSLTSAWSLEQQADAKKLLKELRAKMTSAQIQDAESRAR